MVLDRIGDGEITAEQANEILKSLVSDEVALQKELALGNGKEFTSSEKSQYLQFVARIFESMAEFAGRGFSVFESNPVLRIKGIDVNDPDSLRAAAKKLHKAAKVIEGK